MGFKCGIVGLPNVGKSTLFNALTKAGIEAANYPFCTIEPNVGIVPVPDSRLQQIAEIAKSQQTIHTTMQFVDIAGLVEGAATGEGLGNQFLAHIRETQAIAHVVRCFEQTDVVHVAGKINPLADIEVVETELLLADIQSVEKALLRISKVAKRSEKSGSQMLAEFEQLLEHLNAGKPARQFISREESALAELKSLQLITMKPVLYIANVDETGFENNSYLNQLKDFAEQNNALVVPICAQLESEINDLAPEEQKEFLASMHLAEPGLHRLIQSGYKLLNLQTYFTAGPKEARAWTIPVGARAVEAAGVIHSDFAKGFIRAEVISYQDYIDFSGEQGAKEAGKWRLEGKDYIVADGDIMLFRFNV